MDVGSTVRSEQATKEGADGDGGDSTGKTGSIGAAGEQPPAIPGPAALSDRLPTPLLFPLLAYGAAWALIVAAWQVANAVYRVPWAWERYFLSQDGAYYNWLAIHGYAGPREVPPTLAQAAHFPVLPLLVKTVSYMTQAQYLPAEMLVQVVAGALAVIAVWALAARIGDRRLADRTVLLFCAFPGAMTFGMLYPEPLGTALTAFCLLDALNRKWLLAGLLALA